MPLPLLGALAIGAGSSLLKYWGDTVEADRQKKLIDEAYQPIEDTSAIDRQAASRQAGTMVTQAGRANQRLVSASGLSSSGASANAAGQAQGQANDWLQQENDRISRMQLQTKEVNQRIAQAKKLAEMGIQVNMADYIAPALNIGMATYQAFNPQEFLPQGGQQVEPFNQQPLPQVPQQAMQNPSIQPQGFGVQQPMLPNGLYPQQNGMRIPFETPWYNDRIPNNYRNITGSPIARNR